MEYIKKAALSLLISGMIASPAAVYAKSAMTSAEKDYARKASVYFEKKEFDEAIKEFEGLVREFPDSALYNFYLGLSYYGKESLDEAKKYLSKAIELDPDSAEAYYHLALIEHKRGNNNTVINYLNEVTSLDSNFQSAYYNKGVTYLSMNLPKRAVKEFAYAIYLDPMDKYSLAGLLQASEMLNLVQVDNSQGEVEAMIPTEEEKEPILAERTPYGVLSAPPLKAGNSSLGEAIKEPEEEVEEAPNKIEEEEAAVEENTGGFAMFLNTAGGKKQISKTGGKSVALISSEDAKGSLEIAFSKALDLKEKTLLLEIKGANGGEKLGLSLRDKATKRSPFLYIRDITDNWQNYSVQLKEVQGNLDLSQIEYVKLELSKESASGPQSESSVLIRNIDIGGQKVD